MACKICLSGGKTMTRAASKTRSTSPSVISRSGCVMAMRPLLLSEEICSPVTPTYTPSTSCPACFAAMSMASSMARAVASMSTTMPFFMPKDGATPTPVIMNLPMLGQFRDQRADFGRANIQTRNYVVSRHAHVSVRKLIVDS